MLCYNIFEWKSVKYIKLTQHGRFYLSGRKKDGTNMNKQNKKDWTNTFVKILTFILLFGIPFFVGFGYLFGVAYDAIKENIPGIIAFVMTVISIGTCAYCLIRTIIAIVFNVFLPKIPMPKNMIAKCIVLVVLGILIGIFSPIWVLVLWVVACLIGMATYSFV